MSRTLRAIALLALSLCAHHVGSQTPLSIDGVLDFAHATALTESPVGDRVAWVRNYRGVRNVWVAEGPDWAGRRITEYAADDGQAIDSLAFSPDGAAVLFVRGGRANGNGEFPNPTSDPDGAKRTLWVVPFSDADRLPRALADTGTYEVFPDGERFAYVQGGQIWVAPLAASPPASADELSAPVPDASPDEGAAPEPTQLFSVRRGVAGFTISPDGGRIAFVSNRGDHAFVGVYHLEAESLTWLHPSVDHDTYPVWSPDSTRVAFLRQPHEAQVLPFMPRREGLPWSIHVADVDTGATREIFRASPGPGSALGAGYWFVGDRLWWGADDRILFPWEKTDWLHIWSVSADGGEAVDLTPGEGEVQHAELTPDRRHLLVASNHGDIDRRHLWRSAVGGGAFTPMTEGDGIEWAPRHTAASKTLVFLASGVRDPAHAVAMVSGKRRALAPSSGRAFPAQALVPPQAVSFPAADGMRIPGQLFSPPVSCGDGPHPGLLFFHGGSRRQMMLGFHPSQYYANAYAFNQVMASRCTVVLSVNYRSGIGYGLDFREALDYGARGASEFRDVVGAGLYLAQRADVEASRIGLWGGSYGGYLTALGLARAPDLFAAGVDLHGVHDWNVVIGNFATDYDPQAREAFARVAGLSSPISDLSRWRAPVLLIHGDDDRNVPFSESVSLTESLRRQGTPVELLVFPDEVHGFLLHRNWLAAYEASAKFLGRELAVGER
ncbi:MAG: prolyl oligopeptidase family serine peptidase [Pseudomonadota bacterium]